MSYNIQKENTVKITLEQAVIGFNALQRIGNEKLPIKLAYTLQRNMRHLQPDVKAYEEQRVELIKTKYGIKDENENWSVKPDKVSAFGKQLETLGSVELELDIHTINLEDVNMNIAPNDLFALEWMFVETPPEPQKQKVVKKK
jgi:hypothetical protein